METSRQTNALGRDLLGLASTFLACFTLLAVVTHHPHDPGLNQVVSPGAPIHNGGGLPGAYLASILVDLFGVAAYLCPAALLLFALKTFIRRLHFPWWRWVGFALFTVVTAAFAAPGDASGSGFAIGRVHGGGFIGGFLSDTLRYVLGSVVAALLGIVGLLASVQLMLGRLWENALAPVISPVVSRVRDVRAKRAERQRRKKRLQQLMEQLEASGEDPDRAAAILDAELGGGLSAGSSVPREDPTAEDAPQIPRATTPVMSESSAPPAIDENTPVEALVSRVTPQEAPVDRAPEAVRDGRPDVPNHPPTTAPRALAGEAGEAGEPDAMNEPDAMGEARPSVTATPQALSLPQRETSHTEAAAPAPHEARAESPAEHAELFDEDLFSTVEEDPEPTHVPSSPQEARGGRDVVAEAEINPDADLRGSAPPSARSLRRLELPTKDLLAAIEVTPRAASHEELTRQAQALTTTLADFGVQGEVTNIRPGPVVTCFEYKPAPGVKVSKIANLSDDLALTLKAMAVRIEAPIPGKDAVGIEIPSKFRQVVHYRDVLESSAFRDSESLLTLCLGKDIEGEPCVADLAKMPHLLVAGATGMGKSVCLNGLILSMLFKAKPSQVKMLLVDPKRIELAVYADLPHLIHPVVTEMNLAKNALEWAVHEMDQRYQAMAQLAVRNIAGYNAKIATLDHARRVVLDRPEPMPYLVIIIDELADLMLTAAKEVEMSIVRLAQLARAAGIHMILATQRPSVDVVTGLIKANFPCRISFQVTSKHDSRTILDSVGAEHLLGKGDMLFKPSGGKLQRLHGAYVSDEDVHAVVDFWKRQQKPEYSMDFSEWSADGEEEGVLEGGPGEMDGDPKYREAVDFVTSQGKASISLLQRRFRIGFNRAARYIEQMELDGYLGPADGSKPRVVLRGREE